MRARSVSERLWSKVQRGAKGECWLWTGAKCRGYGHIKVDGSSVPAHRVAFELTVGPIPCGLLACHTCDNRACCNPAHIFLGTDADNNWDKVRKNRHNPARGQRHGSRTRPERVARGEGVTIAKLTESDVRVIRQRFANGAAMAHLAREAGVTPRTVRLLVRRETWRHVA
jgi:hypothetical protein